MDKHTMVSINYREFTDWTEDRMILAKANAASARSNANGDYDDYSSSVFEAACDARLEAFYEAWQMVTINNYDEIDRARLADLL